MGPHVHHRHATRSLVQVLLPLSQNPNLMCHIGNFFSCKKSGLMWHRKVSSCSGSSPASSRLISIMGTAPQSLSSQPLPPLSSCVVVFRRVLGGVRQVHSFRSCRAWFVSPTIEMTPKDASKPFAQVREGSKKKKKKLVCIVFFCLQGSATKD